MSNMSNIIEKTFSAIPSILSSSLKGRTLKEDASFEFQNFIKKLSSFRSREDEAAMILKELDVEKDKLSKPNISAKEKKESLTRLLYCHMMGYDVSFGYIHAVKLAQQGNLLEKRTGYLMCSLFFDETHELSMLLINTIQKDLRSTNILEICTALTAACQVVNTEMIPALLPMVQEKLTHNKEVVRKKAVICLQRFHQKAPELIEHLHHLFEKALCDRDPGVMWASLHIYLDIVKDDPSKYKRLNGVLTDILMQVVSRKLPTDYDYHSVPAPWLSINLLKLLAQLGHGCESTSMQIYPVVKEVLQRTEPTQKMGLAIIYECLETICTIYPQPNLLEHAAKCVTKFLSAKNINLRYLGLKALEKIVSIDPKYALDHQQIVLECLDHPDQTVKTQTYNLLLQIANPENIHVISGKLVECLKQTTDRNNQRDLAGKIKTLTDRYHQNSQFCAKVEWYLNTINQLIILALDFVPKDLPCQTVTVLEYKSEEVHMYAVTLYWRMLQVEDQPHLLVELASWVVSKYWQLLQNVNSIQLSSCLLSWLSRCNNITSQKTVVQGLQRLLPHVPQEQMSLFVESIEAAIKSKDRHTHQMIKEMKVLINYPTVFAQVTCGSSDTKMDFTLSFLDNYVCAALEKGASVYKPATFRQYKQIIQLGENGPGIKYQAYEVPSATSDKSFSMQHSLPRPGSSVISVTSDDSTGNLELQMKDVKKVWSKDGFRKKDSKDTSSEFNTLREKQSTNKSEEEIKADFQTALFSGITSPMKQVNNTQITTTAEIVNTSNYTPICDNKISSSHTSSTNELIEVQYSGNNYIPDISEKSHCDYGNPALSNLGNDTFLASQNVIVEEKHVKKKQNSDVIVTPPQLTNIQKERNFESDSLDGDSDSPPHLFRSEHEEHSLTLEERFTFSEDVVPNNGQFFTVAKNNESKASISKRNNEGTDV